MARELLELTGTAADVVAVDGRTFRLTHGHHRLVLTIDYRRTGGNRWKHRNSTLTQDGQRRSNVVDAHEYAALFKTLLGETPERSFTLLPAGVRAPFLVAVTVAALRRLAPNAEVDFGQEGHRHIVRAVTPDGRTAYLTFAWNSEHGEYAPHPREFITLIDSDGNTVDLDAVVVEDAFIVALRRLRDEPSPKEAVREVRAMKPRDAARSNAVDVRRATVYRI